MRRPPPSTASAVLRFVTASVAAIAVVVVGGYLALRSVAIDEAERDTRQQVQLEGRLVESAALSDGVLRGDRDALARLDDLVIGQVVTGSVVRLKIWTQGGRILYSDEPALIGRTFGLGEEARALRARRRRRRALRPLRAREPVRAPGGRLLEAHTVIRTPGGTPVLFETYQRFSSITDSGSRLLGAIAPPLLGGLLVLLLFQVPLAFSLARRLQRGHEERAALLENAIEASDAERRHIAADLHDGVVQDLAGVAFGLAPLAEAAERRGARDEASVLHSAIMSLRQGVRGLRTLLVEIHPPTLESAGLEAALNDLLSPLDAKGMRTELRVDDRATATSRHDALVYRVAREALRNVQEHAGASAVEVAVSRCDAGATRLTVHDDGRGFAPQERERRGEEGHVGLRLLEGLVARSDGHLEVHSEPGAGTTVQLEVAP